MVDKILFQCIQYLRITIIISDKISYCSGEYKAPPFWLETLNR